MNWGLADLGTSPLPVISYVTLGATANLSIYQYHHLLVRELIAE